MIGPFNQMQDQQFQYFSSLQPLVATEKLVIDKGHLAFHLSASPLCLGMDLSANAVCLLYFLDNYWIEEKKGKLVAKFPLL